MSIQGDLTQPQSEPSKQAVYLPSSIELKCLRQLDHVENWEILKRERPSESEILHWRPFIRIFWFNFALLSTLLAMALFLVDWKSGASIEDIKGDGPFGAAVTVGIAGIMSIYVTHLYRRSWNRRAKFLA
jgi:hypothetical protein